MSVSGSEKSKKHLRLKFRVHLVSRLVMLVAVMAWDDIVTLSVLDAGVA